MTPSYRECTGEWEKPLMTQYIDHAAHCFPKHVTLKPDQTGTPMRMGIKQLSKFEILTKRHALNSITPSHIITTPSNNKISKVAHFNFYWWGFLFWKCDTNNQFINTFCKIYLLIKLDLNRRLISPCDLDVWWMTSKIIRHIFYTASRFVHDFKSIGEFKLELQSGNAPFGWVKMGDLSSHVTLKIDGWPWKIIGHHSYAASSFVHDFIAIDEFKLELKSRNAQFGSNRRFISRVIIGHLF